MKPAKSILCTLFIIAISMYVHGQYRNVAINLKDVHAAGHGYPHASSNSEYPFPPGVADTVFYALNAINGDTLNTGHGSMQYASWGPQMISGLWWRVDFGHDVQVDKVKIWLRADWAGNPGHDSYWNHATLVFSDSSKEDIGPDSVKFGQEFTFKSRLTNSLTITDLVPNRNTWCGFTEVQIWGYDPPTSLISSSGGIKKNRSAESKTVCFVPGLSTRVSAFPPDMRSVELFSIQGKKIWTKTRGEVRNADLFILPLTLAKGIYQLKFLKD